MSKLSDTFRQEITWNGFPCDLMKSGIQKYIRRGITDKALFCAGEIDLFKEAPMRGETIRTNFLHRLLIIYLEDVENTAMLEQVDKYITLLFAERTKEDRSKQKEELWITELITLLCASKKARVASHVRALQRADKEFEAKYPSIPWSQLTEGDLEYHCHMFKKYLQEKNILATYHANKIHHSTEKLKEKIYKSSKPTWFIFKELYSPFTSKMLDIYMKWYKEYIGSMKEGFLCWLIPLLYVLRIIPDGTLPILSDTSDASDISKTWDRNRAGILIEIDDYVADRHTKKGRNKSLTEFAVNGAHVENEAEFVNPLWKQLYEDRKRWEDGLPIVGEVEAVEAVAVEVAVPKKRIGKIIQKETDYEFIIRTQITTSASKMDVYFAKTPQDNYVVIKGPYSDKKDIDVLIANTEWKKKHNIEYIPFTVEYLIPDRWPEGIPLGARNKLDRSKPAYFILFDSLFDTFPLPTKIHSSKVWPDTEVVDWDKFKFHYEYALSTEQQQIDYIQALIFRYVLGISDVANRNFLMVDDRTISIDEDIEGREVDLYKELKKSKAQYVHDWLELYYDELQLDWEVKEERQKYLEQVKTKEGCMALFKESK
jgi:hypothetical protein